MLIARPRVFDTRPLDRLGDEGLVRRERLEAAVDHGHSRRGHAHHGGQHGQGHLEVVVVSPALAADAPVVEVHHAVGARLQLREPGEIAVDVESAGGAAAHNLRGQVVLLEQIARLHEPAHPAVRGLAAVGVALDVRAVSGIALEAAKVERGLERDETAQVHGGLARLGACAATAHVHVHQHVRDPARAGHGLPQLADVLGIVHHYHRLGRAIEHAHEPADLLGPDHLGGDEDVADARGGHHLRLAHLGAADADGARGDLAPRDLLALVRLRVRAELLAHGLHVGGHLGDVPLEAVQVQQ